MKHFYSFSRLAAIMLAAVLTLSQSAFAENVEVTINCLKGEIYTGEWSTRIYTGNSAEPYQTIPSDGNVDIFPKLVETDGFGHKHYVMGPIYCRAAGTATLRVQEERYDETTGDGMGFTTYIFTVVVSEEPVILPTNFDDYVLSDSFQPDPTVVHDTTITEGTSIDNWIKLAYVTYCGFINEWKEENFRRSWEEIPADNITIYCDHPEWVELSPYFDNVQYVTNMAFVAKSGSAGKTVTITVSCAPDANNTWIPNKGFSFRINVAAVPKQDINLYFAQWNTTIQDWAPWSGENFIMDDYGFYEPSSYSLPQLMWSLPGKPDVVLTTIDPNDILDGDASIMPGQPESENFVDYHLNSYTNGIVHYGTATIKATFAGNELYNPATATMTVTATYGRHAYDATDLVYKLETNPWSYVFNIIVEDMTVTEGDTVRLPQICHRNSTQFEVHKVDETGKSARNHFSFPWVNPNCREVNCKVYGDRIVPFAAGEDTLIESFRFYEDWDLIVMKLPIHINPLVTPVSGDSQTQFDFSTIDPEGDQSIIFSSSAFDRRNETTGMLEISTTLSPEEVDAFIAENTPGTEEWLENLKGALTINLPAGKGKFSIECYTAPGYEFKLKIRGKETVTVKQTTMSTAEVNFDLVEPTAVIIYLATSVSASPAPNHAPAAKTDNTVKGYIKSVSILPQNTPTAIEQTEHDVFGSSSVEKRMENGQLIIIRNGERYNAQGQIVK